ncbi:hypothetical protein [Spirosoma endophyticum]|uniref:Uncharacterized protein n=1 Tax=Spirosoma endophyticum TaxID=662367 RepID=A0A1I1R104_9BACT|nr:hypothetical protein [Spirosoma endophyticum]SFD27995.1 hypothetical protein SAMN05216167_104199 [Spirosoma endophyticum]
MIKLVIAAMLVSSTAFAQQAQTPSDNKRAGVAEKASGSTESTTRSQSKTAVAASTRPLPQPSMKEKLESGDRAIPSYKKEKDAGVHKGRAKYPAKQTAGGAPKKS